ncbi:hypothetical protein CAPTEDRAFT_203099 [Capitella teleta]|uniref:Uncharacterized protein n=1 Tax=Capitella teleta TaxID=283909 RepID=R7V5D4_CAPTE|nr:hypothetical protein CAPTEDRAFT_203099 [Capitella teleta]|eukprot:ELU11000.1 hypothetical protein CAPTEDRAFT_203099 [Capitella teleta]
MANDTMRLSYRLDLRSLSITLLGSNNRTLTGTVNLSANADVARQEATTNDDYDDSGAAYYVCAVILVYGLSIVSLIGSLAKKKMKDNKVEQEEVQIDRYLNNASNLREKTARDNYKQLKKSVIKLVEERSPGTTPQASASSSEQKKTLPSATNQGKTSLELRQPTPRHYKGKSQGKNGQRRPESQSLLSSDNLDEYEESPVESAEVHEREGTYAESMQRSVPVQRLPLTHDELLDEEEEKITVVKTEAKKVEDRNILLRPSDEQTEPSFRWSLGDDGNIWIMQVDAKGESKPADPPLVDSLPPPPSPGFEWPRVNDCPKPLGPTTFGIEDERCVRLRSQSPEPTSSSYRAPPPSTSADQSAVPLLRDLRQVSKIAGEKVDRFNDSGFSVNPNDPDECSDPDYIARIRLHTKKYIKYFYALKMHLKFSFKTVPESKDWDAENAWS